MRIPGKYLERGRRIREILKQNQYDPYSVMEQIVILLMVNKGLWDDVPIEDIKEKIIELKKHLKDKFPEDEIVPVPKGKKGADVIQKISDRSGHLCGQIVWESKKTKAWSEGWIQKLKDDQRVVKADLAVIISNVLPTDVVTFAFRDGVWICDIKLTIALATALRMNLESINRERTMSVGKNEKMEILYTYLTGVEFKQRVEAIVEAFSNMDEGLKKRGWFLKKFGLNEKNRLKK